MYGVLFERYKALAKELISGKWFSTHYVSRELKNIPDMGIRNFMIFSRSNIMQEHHMISRIALNYFHENHTWYRI